MSYTIRRWLSSGGMLFDESATAKTTEEAINQAERLSGMFRRSVITEDAKKKINELEPGEVFSIRKPSIKFSMRIKRTKR